MIDKLTAIGAQALKDIEAAGNLDALEHVRVSVLGKKGALSEVLKGLGAVSAQDRPKIGAAANEWKSKIEGALETRKLKLEQALVEQKVQTEKIDVTLPARAPFQGSLHLVTQTTRRIIEVFGRLGFDITTGPEV